MPISLKMPALSPTMEEGTLSTWLIKEGDNVSSGDLMAEIETDKATMEFEAVDEGILAKILIPAGTDNVKVGEVIAILAEEGEDVGDIAAADHSSKESSAAVMETAPPIGKADANISPSARRVAEQKGVDISTIMGTGPKGKIVKADVENAVNAGNNAMDTKPATNADRVKASPLARRIAADKGLDLANIAGSGPNGRIVKADVENAQSNGHSSGQAASTSQPAASAPSSAPAMAQSAPVNPGDIPHEVQKLSNMRKTIARRLTEAKQSIPHIYLTVDINIDKLLKLRSELNAGLEARGVKLSVNDLLIKALAQALIAVPKCNVSFAGDNLIQYHRADISVAVSIEGGLITPIVVNANEKSLSAISNEVKDLAGRAKEGKLQPHEYQGGTASLSNMGMFGIKQFDAVINPPQAMIMAISAGMKQPAVIDDSLQIATMMSVTGSFDHRAIDGADGAQFMKVFKELIENPLSMLA